MLQIQVVWFWLDNHDLINCVQFFAGNLSLTQHICLHFILYFYFFIISDVNLSISHLEFIWVWLWCIRKSLCTVHKSQHINHFAMEMVSVSWTPKPFCNENGFCELYSKTILLWKWFMCVVLQNHLAVGMVSRNVCCGNGFQQFIFWAFTSNP